MQRQLLALALSAALGPMGSGTALAAEKAATAAPPAASQAKAAVAKPPLPAKRVDINSASKAELKTLPGIGDAEADRIIKARPYPSKAKLAVDKVIPGALYNALQGRIVAVQPPALAKAKAGAAAKP